MIRRLQVRREEPEGGYTLIELLIVIVIAPMIIGVICVALIVVLSLQGGVGSRISDAGDAQIVSSHFDLDVQSALGLTTSTVVKCGTGSNVTQLLGLEWNLNATSNIDQTVVSYVKVKTGTSYSLVRNYCANGASLTPTSSSVVSLDVASGLVAPVITPANANATSAWVTTQGVTGVKFAITEPGSSYSYSLVALPAAGAYTSPSVPNAAQTTSCGYATPGTGTYASTLCFVSFPVPPPQGVVGTACQNVSAAVAGTPYIVSFCLVATGASVKSTFMPTYPNAFLGIGGFYTGIPGSGALYQTASGTTIVTLTNIKVLDSNGNPATGWSLVTGDAETTDAGEYMIWTSDQNLTLLPNNPSAAAATPTAAIPQIGNACGYTPAPAGTLFPSTYLTGVGTTSVECAASVSGSKSGTVMLAALTPTTLTVTMHGTGLEAMFVGLIP